MELKEELVIMKKELNEVKQQSFAMELLKDYRKMNKRLFIIIVTILCMWFATIGIGIYYITHYTYEEVVETAEVDNESGNANACIGDKCNNGEIYYGESESN